MTTGYLGGGELSNNTLEDGDGELGLGLCDVDRLIQNITSSFKSKIILTEQLI